MNREIRRPKPEIRNNTSISIFIGLFSGWCFGPPAAVSAENFGGLAVKYPGDAGIERDPQVLFAENFETGSLEEIGKRWGEISNPDGQVMAFSGELPPGSGGRRSLQMTNHVASPNPVNRVWFDDIVIGTEYIGPLQK